MLFDLRSPGRRFAVKIVYALLAVVLGGGLILFGVGSGTNGGLFDGVFGNGNSSSGSDALVKRADAQQKRTAAAPTAANYAALARLRALSAGSDFDDQTGQFNEDGLAQLRLADAAWKRHLEKAGNKPDAQVASVMLQAYAPGALNQPADGYQAQEIVIEATGADPTAQQFAQLAYWAYLAKNTRQAELARKKALELATPANRAQIKAALDSYKAATSAQTATTGG